MRGGGRRGAGLGTVQGVFWNGAHDVATVVDAEGLERLVPVVGDFILSVSPCSPNARAVDRRCLTPIRLD